MQNEIVNAATADDEFQRFADHWGLFTDTSEMEEEDRASFSPLKLRLTKAIRGGNFTVDEVGSTLTYTLMFPEDAGVEVMEIRPPKGSAISGFDKHKDREGVKKMNSFMAAMTGKNPIVFSKMDYRDLKIFQAVAQLFLGS
tara:strand:+ start:1912 stop:2334 length:423 start_codon:yes stop_codon:yes gene_type:complete